jgi:micrococcal nuclease
MWLWLAALGGCDLFAPPVEPGQAEVGAEAPQHVEAPFDGGPFGNPKQEQSPDAAANALSLELTGRVVRVGDGDTITVEDPSGRTWKVRLVGIDAPELTQPFGEHSREALFRMTRGKAVRVRWQEQDQFDRVLGEVYLGDQNVNEAQVRSGWAWKYLHAHSATLASAERAARSNKAGLWVHENPTPPWEFRRNEPRRERRR